MAHLSEPNMAHLSLHPPGLPPPLSHPIIGKVQGRYNKGVVQYLGLKYAALDHRLADPRIIEYSEHEVIDATCYGPPVVTPAGSAEMEMSFIGEQLPKPDLPLMSDLHGLNLNVTVPQDGAKNLPVVIYIHGGGFAFGSSSYPHYDQSKVVELSAIMDQRIVAVNLNYRLGIPGFLDSKELRDAGINANRGLRDQRAALEWVRRYIAGFGGDPSCITLVGQSAGAASVNFQMLSEQPLFQQAILLGGSFLMMRPASKDITEHLYKSVTHSLGLEGLTPEDRINAIITMPAEKLVDHVTSQMLSLGPVVDGDFIPVAPSFTSLTSNDFHLPGKTWCRRLYLIESQYDGSIFGQVNLNRRENGITSAFISSVKSSLPTETSSALLSFYNITPDTPCQEALESIIQFVTDIAFHAPAVKLAEAWPGPSYVGYFNERNPFEGQYKGRASHLLDTAYMWGNYNQKYSKQNWIVARALAEAMVAFVHNKDKMPAFNCEAAEGKPRLVTVYGPSEEGVSSKIAEFGSEAAGRNDGIFEVAKGHGGLDALLDAMVTFLQG